MSVARSPELAAWRVPVACGWFTVALCLLLALSNVVHFSYHSGSGVVGWIAYHQYPKQQEAFWFIAALAGIPLVMLAGWFGWVLSAAYVAKRARCSPLKTLQLLAMLHLPVLFAWPWIAHLRTDAWKMIAPAIAIALAVSAAAVMRVPFMNRFFTDTVTGTVEVEPAPFENNTVLHSPWRILRTILLFVVIPGLLYLLRLNIGTSDSVDLLEDAHFLFPMDLMLKGGVPYRDIFLPHGFFYDAGFPLIAGKIFGSTLSGLHTLGAYIEPLGVVAFYFLVVVACRQRLLVSALMLFLGSAMWVPSRAIFGMLSLTVLASRLESPNGFAIFKTKLGLRQTWPFLLSGCLAMLALLHSVDVGVFSFCSISLFLGGISIMRRRILPLSLFAIGAGATIVPFALYLAYHGAIRVFLHDTWILCVYQIDIWGVPFRNFFDVFKPFVDGALHQSWWDWFINGDVRWYYGPIAFTLSASFLAFRAMGKGFWGSRTAPVVLLLTLAGAFYFRTALGRSDAEHLFYGSLFALLLAIIAVDRLLSKSLDLLSPRKVAGVPILLCSIAASAGLIWFCNASYQPLPALNARLSRLTSPSEQPSSQSSVLPRLGTSQIPPEQEARIRGVSEYIREHTRPNEPVFDFSNQAGFIFFADRPSASRYMNVVSAGTPEMQEEVVRGLERQKTSLVIFKAGTVFDDIDNVPAEQRLPVIFHYLKANYEYSGQVGQVVFWRKLGAAE
jgi:hypothetical protein